MSSTVLPNPRPAESGTCPAWCHLHNDDENVCLSATAVVDVTDAPAAMIGGFLANLARSGDGTTVLFGPVGYGFESTVDTAEDIANALLHLVTMARAGASTTPAGGAR